VHGDEDYVVTGLEVLLASVRRREAHVDTFVDATKYSMCDYILHVQHYTRLVVFYNFYTMG
jgi:hypothetical protein